MTTLNHAYSNQPFIRKEMPYYVNKADCWSSDPLSPKVYYEEFQNDDREIKLDIFPDGFSTICFEICNHQASAVYFGRMTNVKQVYYRQGKRYFSVKIPPHFVFSNIKEPIHFYQNRVSKIRTFTDAFNEFDFSGFAVLSFLKRIEYFQGFVATHFAVEENRIINFVIEKSISSMEILTIEQLADELDVSSRFIRYVFKKNIGTSPKATIQSIRFQIALSEILDGSKKVTDAYLETAFFDHPHFNKFFKNRTNYTPSALKDLLNK